MLEKNEKKTVKSNNKLKTKTNKQLNERRKPTILRLALQILLSPKTLYTYRLVDYRQFKHLNVSDEHEGRTYTFAFFLLYVCKNILEIQWLVPLLHTSSSIEMLSHFLKHHS